ncbi:MAG: ATP-binding protein [Bacillota bacterium]
MRKSLYTKLVLIFVGILFVSNFIAFTTYYFKTAKNLRSEIGTETVQLSKQIKDIWINKHVSESSIEALLNDSYFKVKFYNNFSQLEADPALAHFFDRNALKSLSQSKSESNEIKLNSNAPHELSVIVTRVDTPQGAKYFVVYPDLRKSLFGVKSLLMRMNISSLVIGIIMTLFATMLIIKPIKKLKAATHRISSGDFDVSIVNRRKDEIGQLIDDFNIMVKELKGIEILRNDFVTAISHEFKTPLTSIEGYTKLLKNCHDENERNEYIGIITEETRRLSQLSSNILLLNRLEHENISSHKESFRLDEQIRRVILLLESKWNGKDIELDISLDEIMFTGNEQLLFQVWLNLLDNALKFSPDGGKIELSLKRDGSAVIFHIKDYGKGIKPEQQKRMFEKFFKGDQSRNSDGNGLGLSIVQMIVDMHGGKITIDSEVGKGTGIYIKL